MCVSMIAKRPTTGFRRRHTGVAGGEGRITWKPLEIQRFSGDYTTIDIIDFVGSNAGYSKQEWQQAQSALGGGEVHESYTTVGVGGRSGALGDQGGNGTVAEDPVSGS